jgi:hypothetical protein
LITSDKSGELNYFPASSEFSHIVTELEKYIETPEESSLTFDFKITNYLTSWETQFAYWVYSYSRNCITIKLLNKDLKIYRNFGVKSTDNFILLDDIKLFAVTWNRVTKFNSYGFVEQEICDYILNKIKNKPKELILSTSSVKSRLRSNYLSLKQIQESRLSQSRLDKLESEIVHYLSKFLLQQEAENQIYKHHILPLKVADIKLVFPQFEERLVKDLADSNKQFDYNVFRKLKATYHLSDKFLKLYLDELSKSSKRRTYYAIVTKESYKFILNLLWNNRKGEEEFKHYCEILLNEFPDSIRFSCPSNTSISEKQDSIVLPIFKKIVLEREAKGW